jgi:hypothetical protein
VSWMEAPPNVEAPAVSSASSSAWVPRRPLVSSTARVVTRDRCVRCAEETLRRAALRGLAQKVQSGVREQGRYAACWLGCGRANIREAREACTRGRRAVRAPREQKLRRTYSPRSSPAGHWHCGFLGSWADASAARPSGPKMGVSVRAICAPYGTARAETLCGS